jgi:Tfp pilus assembly pilus retraction ATPase PilT
VIEDPIEVLFRDDVASINQREVGNDTEASSRRFEPPCGRTRT